MSKCQHCQHCWRTLPAYPGPYEMEDHRPPVSDPDKPKEQFEPRPRQIKRLIWCANPASLKFKSDVKPDATEPCFVRYVPPPKREIPHETKRKARDPKKKRHDHPGVRASQNDRVATTDRPTGESAD